MAAGLRPADGRLQLGQRPDNNNIVGQEACRGKLMPGALSYEIMIAAKDAEVLPQAGDAAALEQALAAAASGSVVASRMEDLPKIIASLPKEHQTAGKGDASRGGGGGGGGGGGSGGDMATALVTAYPNNVARARRFFRATYLGSRGRRGLG